MKKKIGSLMVVLILVTQGCNLDDESYSDAAPLPPPPVLRHPNGGLFGGVLRLEPRAPFAGGAVNAWALVAETGEFRLILPDQSEQVFGTFVFDHGDVATTGDAIWAGPLTAENSAGELFGSIAMWGYYGTQSGFSGNFESAWTTFEERVGSFELRYQRTSYESPSSLEYLRGTYSTDTESMSINAQGAIFYQSATSGCTGNGMVQVIDPNYNVYRIEIEVGSCSGIDAVRNGRTFTGLAYKGANNDYGGGFINATLDMAVSASYLNDFGHSRFLIWSLRLDKQ